MSMHLAQVAKAWIAKHAWVPWKTTLEDGVTQIVAPTELSGDVKYLAVTTDASGYVTQIGYKPISTTPWYQVKTADTYNTPSDANLSMPVWVSSRSSYCDTPAGTGPNPYYAKVAMWLPNGDMLVRSRQVDTSTGEYKATFNPASGQDGKAVNHQTLIDMRDYLRAELATKQPSLPVGTDGYFLCYTSSGVEWRAISTTPWYKVRTPTGLSAGDIVTAEVPIWWNDRYSGIYAGDQPSSVCKIAMWYPDGDFLVRSYQVDPMTGDFTNTPNPALGVGGMAINRQTLIDMREYLKAEIATKQPVLPVGTDGYFLCYTSSGVVWREPAAGMSTSVVTFPVKGFTYDGVTMDATGYDLSLRLLVTYTSPTGVATVRGWQLYRTHAGNPANISATVLRFFHASGNKPASMNLSVSLDTGSLIFSKIDAQTGHDLLVGVFCDSQAQTSYTSSGVDMLEYSGGYLPQDFYQRVPVELIGAITQSSDSFTIRFWPNKVSTNYWKFVLPFGSM